MLKRKTTPAVKVLSLIIPVLLLGVIVLCRDIAGYRAGSDTEFGAVYRIMFQGGTMWKWYVFNRNGTIREQALTKETPYIFQNGDRITVILQKEGGIYGETEYRNYSLENPDAEVTEVHYSDVPEISEKLNIYYCWAKKLNTGNEYVKFYQFSNKKMPAKLYGWNAFDKQGKFIWGAFSETEPEILVHSEQEYGIIFQLEGEQKETAMFVNPETGDTSHFYHLEENGTVFTEQVVHQMQGLTEQVIHQNINSQEKHFVNTDTVEELISLDDVYARAKREVNIDYSFVTFYHDNVFSEWEVKFSDRENSEKWQIICMTDEGKTELILNGKTVE